MTVDPPASERNAGRLPDFLIVGAAKAGTTTLYQHLARHPDVFMSTPKEPKFFSHPEPWERGEEWYRSLFAGAGRDQLAGEASTAYSWYPHGPDVPQRIAKLLSPEVKLIYLMRHPVDRAYSNYLMERHRLNESFEDRLAKSDFYVNLGTYIRQIEHYLRYFPRQSLHLILFDDMTTEPGRVLMEVQRFLGLEETDLVGDRPIRANERQRKERQRATARLRGVSGASWVIDRIPKSVRDRVYDVVSRSPAGRRMEAGPPPLRSDTRAKLLERFEEPNRELEEFLGRDLSAWRT
jgi:hypothetical protein